MKESLSIILPTYNEKENITPLINELFSLCVGFDLEILVVDDNSLDGTVEIVRKLAQSDPRIRLIRRLGRSGLASAIKEGLLNATSEIAAVMDSDGQHQPSDLCNAISKLRDEKCDLIIGSRFLEKAKIRGLSNTRASGSSLANSLARFSLPKAYSHITDYMSGCAVFRLKVCLPMIYKVDVNGFKFLYELLAVSKGRLRIGEFPLIFQPRLYGKSKLDFSILWDFLISFLHTFGFRILPRRAISFALVGSSGVLIQLTCTQLLMNLLGLGFPQALPLSVLGAATSNYLINNLLTFREHRLSGTSLFQGLMKYLIVASLPVMANIGLANTFYNSIAKDTFLAQMAGILVVFIWNYVASSRFVWNTP